MKKINSIEITCNMCGGKYYTDKDFYISTQATDVDGSLSWIYQFDLNNQGYGSFLDNTESHFHICDECMHWLFNMMAIGPNIKDDYGGKEYGEKSKLEIAYEINEMYKKHNN